MSETSNSPDINIGNNASRISESREFSASSTSCCWKIGVQKALNFSIVSLSGITTGTDFIPDTGTDSSIAARRNNGLFDFPFTSLSGRKEKSRKYDQ